VVLALLILIATPLVVLRTPTDFDIRDRGPRVQGGTAAATDRRQPPGEFVAIAGFVGGAVYPTRDSVAGTGQRRLDLQQLCAIDDTDL
jgi:hypothetical protein